MYLLRYSSTIDTVKGKPLPVARVANLPPLPEISYYSYDADDENDDLSDLGSIEGKPPVSLEQMELSLKQYAKRMG